MVCKSNIDEKPVVARRSAHCVTISDAAGLPIEIFAIENASALDVLAFMASILEQIGLESLAQKEGKTFNHWLGNSIGAQPIGSITPYPKDQG